MRGPGKGNTNNPDGRPKGSKNAKTAQWEQLGDFITKEGAERAMKILGTLDDDTYLDQYNKLLNYFKPRLQSAQVQSKSEVHIKITEPEWDDTDG